MELSALRSHLSVPTLENSETGCSKKNGRSCITLKYACRSGAQEAGKMSKLFFVNIPYNCSDRELQEWVESRGIKTRSIRIVRDLVAGVSPAFGYVELYDDGQIQEAISTLNGKRLRNQTILVKEAQFQGAGAGGRADRRSA
jgi:RNA recognition motif-containing protein